MIKLNCLLSNILQSTCTLMFNGKLLIPTESKFRDEAICRFINTFIYRDLLCGLLKSSTFATLLN